MNGFDSDSLAEAQAANEGAACRNVGLVIETRPDHVDPAEVRRLRWLGVTKVQMGAQSLDDRILELNQRGHDCRRYPARRWPCCAPADSRSSLHWMPNLLGATPESDRLDFARLWEDPALRPDEIKIYPCQLLANAELHDYWLRGEYTPYTTDELIDLIADIKPGIPTLLPGQPGHPRHPLHQRSGRQQAHQPAPGRPDRAEPPRRALPLHPLPRGARPDGRSGGPAAGAAGVPRRQGEEHFLSFENGDDRLAGFLRLQLPGAASPDLGLPDLQGAALVREVHVYGQSLEVGTQQPGAAQHAGLGETLMARAEALAQKRGYSRIAVISALGTRGYYRRLGYELGENYMIKELTAIR